MSKLTFKTKPPRKGYVKYEGFGKHEAKGLRDKFPPHEIQEKALELVNDTMHELIKQLDALGYDQTKVGFYIHYKSD